MYYFEKQELRRLFEVAYGRNRMHHLALVTSLFHATRVSELLSIRGCDVQDGLLSIRRLKGAGKAGAKRHKVTLQPIHFDADPVFDESPLIALAQTNPKERIFPWCRQRLDQVIKAYGEIAGLHPNKLRMHALRHSTALILWRATHEVSAVQQTLGQWASSSCFVYMQVEATDMANAVLAKAFEAETRMRKEV